MDEIVIETCFESNASAILHTFLLNKSDFIIASLLFPVSASRVRQGLPLTSHNFQNVILLEKRRPNVSFLFDLCISKRSKSIHTFRMPCCDMMSFFLASVKHMKAERGGFGGRSFTSAAFGGCLRLSETF
jgi:hypothetical protein